jgi:hypothetical protein
MNHLAADFSKVLRGEPWLGIAGHPPSPKARAANGSPRRALYRAGRCRNHSGRVESRSVCAASMPLVPIGGGSGSEANPALPRHSPEPRPETSCRPPRYAAARTVGRWSEPALAARRPHGHQAQPHVTRRRPGQFALTCGVR